MLMVSLQRPIANSYAPATSSICRCSDMKSFPVGDGLELKNIGAHASQIPKGLMMEELVRLDSAKATLNQVYIGTACGGVCRGSAICELCGDN